MATPRIPLTVQFSKFGTRPPVFVAGTFTEPEWTPQEMQHSPSSDGELLFTAQVFVVPGTEHQYKFRLGPGDWWVLDDNAPTVNDSAGNQNNVLRVSHPTESVANAARQKQATFPHDIKDTSGATRQAISRPKSLAATLASDLEVQADDERSATPIAQVSSTAAEVADTAALLDRDEDRTPVRARGEATDDLNDHESSEYLKTPLFAHESFGAYDFVDDGFQHESVGASEQRRFSKSLKDSFLSSDPDLADPTLEKFPSDRSSIFDALRKIQTTMDDDVIQADGPFATSYASSSRTSLDSVDDYLLSPESLSPTSTRRRDSRQSHSSVGRNRSAVSLGSIAEEDQHKGASSAKSKSVKWSTDAKQESSSQAADDDSWFTIQSSKAGRNVPNSGDSKAQTQPRSSSKKRKKPKKTGIANTDAGAESQPRFITNIFEDSRTK
ncbi:hypothetical protein HJFPF1_02962 [Paramyrothecium foliicola]|nr:hypothetical protein HJFPF1_02962 [Paramyrothecium foliicola]